MLICARRSQYGVISFTYHYCSKCWLIEAWRRPWPGRQGLCRGPGLILYVTTNWAYTFLVLCEQENCRFYRIYFILIHCRMLLSRRLKANLSTRTNVVSDASFTIISLNFGFLVQVISIPSLNLDTCCYVVRCEVVLDNGSTVNHVLHVYNGTRDCCPSVSHFVNLLLVDGKYSCWKRCRRPDDALVVDNEWENCS